MRLRVADILRQNGKSIKFESNDIELSKNYKGVEIIDKIYLTGEALNNEKIISISVEIKLKYKTECCRCLNEIIKDIDIEFKEDIKEFTNESDEEYYYESGYLDLIKPIEDNIVLAVPIKHLCNEDCQGICQRCGVNKQNKEKCNCKDKEYINPNFESLKKLM